MIFGAQALQQYALWLRVGAQVAIGAFVYLVMVTAIWRLRGAPAGPEREVAERIGRLFARRPV